MVSTIKSSKSSRYLKRILSKWGIQLYYYCSWSDLKLERDFRTSLARSWFLWSPWVPLVPCEKSTVGPCVCPCTKPTPFSERGASASQSARCSLRAFRLPTTHLTRGSQPRNDATVPLPTFRGEKRSTITRQAYLKEWLKVKPASKIFLE